jgi:hypothetical protein
MRVVAGLNYAKCLLLNKLKEQMPKEVKLPQRKEPKDPLLMILSPNLVRHGSVWLTFRTLEAHRQLRESFYKHALPLTSVKKMEKKSGKMLKSMKTSLKTKELISTFHSRLANPSFPRSLKSLSQSLMK